MLAGAALAGLLSGCGGAPAATGPVPAPSVAAPAPGTLALCRRVVAALPATLGPDRLPRRPVRAAAGLAVAWGDPAVTAVCGGAPASPTSELVELGPPEGGLVTFVSRDVGAATAFTTVGLPATLTVVLPDRYDAQLLVPLTSVLLRLDR